MKINMFPTFKKIWYWVRNPSDSFDYGLPPVKNIGRTPKETVQGVVFVALYLGFCVLLVLVLN